MPLRAEDHELDLAMDLLDFVSKEFATCQKYVDGRFTTLVQKELTKNGVRLVIEAARCLPQLPDYIAYSDAAGEPDEPTSEEEIFTIDPQAEAEGFLDWYKDNSSLLREQIVVSRERGEPLRRRGQQGEPRRRPLAGMLRGN